MSFLEIIRFPNPNLRIVASKVTDFTNIRPLVSNMYDSMYSSRGVGLAATQVNIHKRVIVTDCSAESEASNPIEFINPTIIEKSEEFIINEEGCLSVPSIFAEVKRSKFVKVHAFDKDGHEFELECEGMLSICIQHEIDHLNGKLFIDYLSAAKRSLIRNEMKKYEKNLKLDKVSV